MYKRFLTMVFCAVVLAVPAAPVLAEGSRLGVLTCNSIPGSRVNLIIRSTTDVHCQFKATDGKVEHYLGETGIALGADLTFSKEEEKDEDADDAEAATANKEALKDGDK